MFQVAVEAGDTTITEILLEFKANIKILAADRMTLLHLAVNRGHHDVANLLIEQKLDVNAKTTKKATALMLSARVNGPDGLQLCQVSMC